MPNFIETVDAAGGATTTYTLGLGHTAQGVLSTGADHDWYRVNLVAGQQYTFAEVGTGTNNVRDTFLRLYDTNGTTVITSNDDGLPNLNSILTFTATTSGTYYLDAGSFANSSAGQYGVSFNTGNRASFDIEMGAGVIDSNLSWNTIPGTAATVTYAYRQTFANSVDAEGFAAPFSQLSNAEIAAVEAALANYSEVANINFQRVNPTGYSDNATILISNYTSFNDGSGAYTYFPGSTSSTSDAGDVRLNTTSVSTTSLPSGSYSNFAILHEIGHSVGLSHPGDYNAAAGVSITYANDAQFIQDSEQYTVLSYFEESNTGGSFNSYPQSLLLYDIYALQQIYGANFSTRAGNTTYGFNSNAGGIYDFATNSSPVLSIWDGGGNDTIDLSGYATNQTFSLVAGTFSNVGGQIANLSIALGAVVENGIGGSGSDTVTGNSADNFLDGGLGNDTLRGGAGNDVLQGGAGDDSLDGANGNDVYYVDSTTDVVTETNASVATGGFDTVYSSVNYTVSANVEQLLLTDGAANVTATGNNNTNYLYGNLHIGGVTLIGLGGNDVLYGSNYADRIDGGDDNDILLAFYSVDGVDTLIGGAGDDVYYLFEQGDVLIEASNGGLDTIYTQASIVTADNIEQFVLYGEAASVIGNDSNNNIFGNNSGNSLSLDGGGGNDWLIGSNQSDTLRGGTENDILQGLGGANQLLGGAGDDQYYSTSSADVITEVAGQGFDTLYANYNISSLADNVEQLVIYGGANSAVGNDFDNTLYGNNNSVGLALDGAGGADLIFGSNFADVVIGGAGSDALYGLGGADRFAYTAGNAGADTIVDFSQGSDHIDLANLGYTAASIGGAIQISGNSSALITFTNGNLAGTTITVLGVAHANVTADDFLFA